VEDAICGDLGEKGRGYACFHSKSVSQRRRPSAIPGRTRLPVLTGPQHAWPAAEATTFLFKIAEEEARVLWCECGAG
jgi:hypothetical protein